MGISLVLVSTHRDSILSMQTPSQFFAANGGTELLKAYGLPTDGDALATFFSASLPAWLKDGVTPKIGTRPAPMGGVAILVVSPGRLIVKAHVAPPAGDLPNGVTVERGVSPKLVQKVASEVMDLPRPLLFLTVGPAYADALKVARISFDPKTIDISGKISATLDKDRLQAIRAAMAEFSLDAKALMRLASMFERMLTGHEMSLSAPALLKCMSKVCGVKAGKKGFAAVDLQNIRDGWRKVSALPPIEDPAWALLTASK